MTGDCFGMQPTMTDKNSANETSQIESLETFWRYFQTDEKYLILSASTLLHFMSALLIATTACMFVCHRSLRTAGHLVHLNLLLSDSMLLLTSWVLGTGTVTGCEIYSMSFLVFGSSSIYTAVVIAYARYEQMKNRCGQNNSLNKHPLLWVFGIWAASLLASIFPIIAKAEQVLKSTSMVTSHICFFVNGITYDRKEQPITFLLIVILAPAVAMSFCYIRIYQNVRSARITRWLNQAAHLYNTHTTIIKGHSRRANVVPRKQSTSQYPMQPNTISDREKHIIIKGLFSVASQLLFWVPFGIAWLMNTSSGFKKDFVLQQIYIMILAKCSVLTNITHYICFNVKFRKLYIKTIVNPLKKFCCNGQLTRIHADISLISQGDSNVPRGISVHSSQTNVSDVKPPAAATLFTLRPIMEANTAANSNNTYSEGRTSQLNLTAKVYRSLSMPSRYFSCRSSFMSPIRNSR